jgi:apolipoprotein N-acyltransferase
MLNLNSINSEKVRKILQYQDILSIISGILYGLSYAPINSIFSAFISLAIFYILSNSATSKKQIIRITILFGTVSYITSLHWIINSLLVDVKQWWFLIPPTLILIPLALSFYYLIITLPIFYLKRKIENNVAIAITFSILWMAAEIAKSILFTGFPWNLLGTIWIDFQNIAQIIYYTNIYFLGFITILFITLLSNIIFYQDHKIINASLIFLITICLGTFIQFDKNKTENKTAKPNSIKIRIIQPNIKQKFKWQESEQENIFLKIIQQSFQKGFLGNTGDKPDLIIWPETAFPFLIDINELENYKYLQFTINHLEKNQILLVGAIRINNESDDVFNSVLAFKNEPSKQLIDFYDKRHLVPFGEYVPFYKKIQDFLQLQFLDDISDLFSNLSFGDQNKSTLKLRENITILPLICYEGIFPYEIQKDQSVKFSINLTNDAWFGKSFGPYQHLRAVQSQVIKSNLPLIRSANSGISAIINSRGKIIKKLDLETEGVLDFILEY